MIDELDLVVLTHDITERGRRRGDVGTVAHRYADGQAFAVAFATAEGAMVAVLTLGPGDPRAAGGREIRPMRDLVPAAT